MAETPKNQGPDATPLSPRSAVRYTPVSDVPWAGSLNDMRHVANVISEKVAHDRDLALQKREAYDEAVAATPASVRALIRILRDERVRHLEGSWATVAEITERGGRLTRVGDADKMLAVVDEARIEDVVITAPREADSVAISARFRRQQGVTVMVEGEDGAWARATAEELRDLVTARRPAAAWLRQPRTLWALSVGLAAPVMLFLGVIARDQVYRPFEDTFRPGVFNPANPLWPTEDIQRLWRLAVAFMCVYVVVLVGAVVVIGASALLRTWAKRALPAFEVLREGSQPATAKAVSFVSFCLLTIVLGVIATWVAAL